MERILLQLGKVFSSKPNVLRHRISKYKGMMDLEVITPLPVLKINIVKEEHVLTHLSRSVRAEQWESHTRFLG